MRKVKCKLIEEEELSMSLLYISPIVARILDGDIESGYEISVDAATHIRQLEHIYNYGHVDVHRWAVFPITDSCALNKNIAVKMEIPHFGCVNHKLALDI